jgi:Signal transduction histidine kinase
MRLFRNLPIRRKLTLVILTTCTVVLLLACGVLAAFEFAHFRRTIVRDTATQADILAKTTRAALAFQDADAATEFLAALHSDRNVAGAAIYAHSGELFASYSRPGAEAVLPPRPGADGHAFDSGYLTVFRPLVLNGKRLGTIGLLVDLEVIYMRFRLFGGIALATLVGSLGLAVALSAWLQRPISGPILALAATAKAIAVRKDYSVRAERMGEHELGVLTDAFNQMLAGIEERERALHEEIAERRQAETKVQAQLARLAQLHQITRATGEREDLSSVFQVVVRSLEDQLPADFCCIGRYDPVEHTLTIASVGVRSRPLAAEIGLEENAVVVIDRNGLQRCVHGHLVYEPDIAGTKFPFPQRLARVGLRSIVASPLSVESTVFGVLIAARRQASAFSSGECEFLRQLSEHVALAAHQAELLQALQRAYDDLRRSQQTILQQERLRALGQMASGIAHDINNAISPVGLYVEALRETETGLSARGREYLATIERAVDDVAQTVRRMREFYRPGEPQLELAPVDLNHLVPHVVELTRVRWSDIALKSGVVIDLRTELTPGLPPVLGVESEIREALTNLVLNAVDAMPAGGDLVLRTRAIPGATPDSAPLIALEVIDSGMGMDEDTRRRCLDPFFTTKGERGTGLGLAMVYGIVQRHGAEIEIESEPGHGTTMRLLFPMHAPEAGAVAAPTAPAQAPRKMRILAIDDDPIIIQSLRDALAMDGHEVVSAGGGQEGIETFQAALVSERPFELVLTDLGMPYVDGSKVAAAVKAASPGTPVVLLTGWGERMIADGDIPPHVDYVLAKPPKLAVLRAALSRLVTDPS